jgi:folate-binding protein YgfZ
MVAGLRGYEALREGAASVDLTGRGVIRATGEDRVRLLHAMTSNHVEQLRAGQGCYAFFLNAQGRILADVNLLCFLEHLLLDTEPETRELVLKHLDKHIIADDVRLEDLTGGTAVVGVEGPQCGEILKTLGAPQPEAWYGHAAWGLRLVARLSSTGALGFRIFAPLEGKAELLGQLESAGAVAAEAEAARTVRLELGRPRDGEDFSDRQVPQETQLFGALHFNKGCYLGQEIVERIRSRGQVHRLLVRLRVESAEAPAAGTKILAGEKEAGEITSAAFSPALGKVVALGYVRRQELGAQTLVTAGGARVEIAG